MTTVIDWLTALPPAVLAVALALLAFVENLVPPIPADTLIAIMTFVAAAADQPIAGLIAAVIVGSAGGGLTTFWLGRRYGADGLMTLMRRRGLVAQEERLERAYARYGMLALFFGRFVPGLRSIVPVFAGALQLPAIASTAVITAASTLWYTALALLAYRAGGSWEAIEASMRGVGRTGAGVAMLTLVAIALILWRRRRTSRAGAQRPR